MEWIVLESEPQAHVPAWVILLHRKRAITGTYPSRQRRCAVLIRSANAAAQLVLRTQAERKAATAAQSGEMKGERSPLHLFSTRLVRYAISGRWCGTTNNTYQRNQHQYIGQSLEQVCQIGIAAQILQGEAKTITQSKYEAGHSGSQGSIFTENHSGQGDITPAIRHIRVEEARNTYRQVGARQA